MPAFLPVSYFNILAACKCYCGLHLWPFY